MTVLVHRLAKMSAEERRLFIDGLNEGELYTLTYDWTFWARPEQITPQGKWNIWLILAGRGWGKTRTGAEDVKAYGLAHARSRIAIVAPTYADARDTCIEGDSGLLNILPKDKIEAWNRSLGELILTNGTRYKLFSADEPERLRGPQNHRAWCDELCAWKHDETFDQLMFGMRLGKRPQVIITTTPKPTKLLKQLVVRQSTDVFLTKGNTFDNAANLAPAALHQLRERYLGTRTGRQELYAEILDDAEGALWKRETMIEAYRVRSHPDLVRVVVAIDPAVTAEEGSDETGMVVAGVGKDGHGYVLGDYSVHVSPMQWAETALRAYADHHADRIVAEVNNGGELVETTIRLVAKDQGMRYVPYAAVHASRGKQTRAEPVSALYERGLVHHVGTFPELEDQMCSWEPGLAKSPDRLDALVWAFTELMVGDGSLTVNEHMSDLKARLYKQMERNVAPTQGSYLLPEPTKGYWE